MSDQQVTATDFGTYLGDESLNTARANMILQQAQSACEDHRAKVGLDPAVPDGKLYVLIRVAERAYTAGRNQGRGYQYASSGVDDGGAPSAAGVYLTDWDKADLLDSGDVEESPSVDAFTIRTGGCATFAPDAYRGRAPWPFW